MRLRRSAVVTALLATCLAVSALPARAGDVVEITEDIIARFFKAHTAETQAQGNVTAQLDELDRKIAAWRECAKTFMAANDASGGKLGLAAKIALKAKCGASSEDGFQKERAKLMEGPTAAANSAGGFKGGQYESLTNRILCFLGGSCSEKFSDGEKSVLGAHKGDLMGALGSRVTTISGDAGPGYTGGAVRGGGGHGHLPSTWGGDAAWGYIGYMFSAMYISGATMFEKPYQPGEWTTWQMLDSASPEEKTTIERAFLLKTPEGSEWWRTTSLVAHDAVVDTVVLEGLFKPLDPDGTIRQLVRMRGKLPGDPEPREMLVPQYMSMLSSLSALPFKPTPESVEGATVGSETVGGVSAKHVKFSGGAGGSTIEWWLADSVPGGWVKFVGTNPQGDGDKPTTWTLELTGKGTGAKSVLGSIK